jgi:predicted DNA-binding transcriptional regulator AlpA
MVKHSKMLLNYAAFGLSRSEASRYIGIGTTLFDKMVKDGRMPMPKIINSRKIWCRIEIEQAFIALPDDGAANDNNPWEGVEW